MTGQTPALSPDGARVAIQVLLDDGVAGPVRIHDTSTGEVVVELDGFCDTVTATFDPVDPACEDESRVSLADWVWKLQYFPDGSRIAMGGYSCGRACSESSGDFSG